MKAMLARRGVGRSWQQPQNFEKFASDTQNGKLDTLLHLWLCAQLPREI
jgi:hypothetical protein